MKLCRRTYATEHIERVLCVMVVGARIAVLRVGSPRRWVMRPCDAAQRGQRRVRDFERTSCTVHSARSLTLG